MDEDGEDEGGVKSSGDCGSDGRTGLVDISASPLASASVTRLGEVDEPFRGGERKIGGRGVSAACVA